MPTAIMIPNNLDETFSKNRISTKVAAAINDKLNTLHDLKSAHFKQKSFGAKTVYTINVDKHGAHRLIFDLVENELGNILVLRNIAFHHNYRKALNWHPFGHISIYELQQLGYQLSEHHSAIDIDTIEALPPAILYQNDWLELSEIQSTILAQKTFPQLIVGPPGSGKTLLSLAFFQEQALQHQDYSNGLLKLLFITEHPTLKTTIEKTWRDWAKQELSPNKPHIKAIFLSFAELNEWYANEHFAEKSMLTSEECLNRLKHFSKNITSLEPILILDELIQSAHLLNDDMAKGKSYLESSYYELGVNQTTLSINDKEKIYRIYQNLTAQLIQDKKLFLNFMPIGNCPLGYEYDFICVDEAQNSSVNNLLNALAMVKNKRIIYCGDSYQRSHKKVSSLQLLGSELYKKQILLTHNTLPITHRLQPSVAQLCENLIVLENNIRGGLPDKTAYSCFASAAKEEECSLNLVKTDNDDCTAIGKNANAAAIILSHDDIDEAKKLIGGDNVFLSSGTQGLQFKQVFLYLSKETQKKFFALNQKMLEKNIGVETTLEKKSNTSPNKGKSNQIDLSVISDLFIALSRSTGEVYVYLEKTSKQTQHKLSRFLPWLISKCQGKNDVIQQESSKEEWLTTINLFITNNHLIQAKDNLCTIFKTSPQLAKDYIKYYQENKKPNLTIEDNMAWLMQSMTPCPKSALPISTATKKTTAPEEKENVSLKQATPLLQKAVESPAISQNNETTLIKSPISQEVPEPKQAQPQFKRLGKKYAQYIEKFIINIDNQENIEKFLADKNLEQKLFFHKMENGLCLFANIFCNEVAIYYFNQHLQNISQQKPELTCKFEVALSNAYSIAKDYSDLPLQFILGILTESNNYQIVINEVPPLEKIIKQIRGTKQKSNFPRLLNQPIESANVALTNFIIKEWQTIEPLLIWQDLIRYQIPKLPTKESGFILCVIHLNKIDFIETNFNNEMLIKAFAKDILIPDNIIGPNATVLFHALLKLEKGVKLLNEQWSKLEPHINIEELTKHVLPFKQNNELPLEPQHQLQTQIIRPVIKTKIRDLNSSCNDKIMSALLVLYKITGDPKSHAIINKHIMINRMFQLVNSDEPNISRCAVCILAYITKSNEKKDDIIDNIINPIYKLITSRQRITQSSGVRSLLQLANAKDDDLRLKDKTLLQAVLKLLETSDSDIKNEALGVLNFILQKNENATLLFKNETIHLIFQQLDSQSETSKYYAKEIILLLLEDNYLEFAINEGKPLIITLLSNNSIKMQKKLTDVFMKLIESHAKIITKSRFILPILELLNSSAIYIQVNAAKTLHLLCQKYFKEIESEKGIELVIKLLGSQHKEVQSAAAGCIANLSTVKELVPKLNCIQTLISLLESSNQDTIYFAIFTLANLASASHNQNTIREYKGIEPLIKLISSPLFKQLSLKALHYLAENHENKQVITKLNGIEPMLSLLSQEGEEACQVFACSALTNIAGAKISHEAFYQNNGMRRFLNLFNNHKTNHQIKSNALQAISYLSTEPSKNICLENKEELTELINFLGSDIIIDKNNASQLLCTLATNVQNRKMIYATNSEVAILTLLNTYDINIKQEIIFELEEYLNHNTFNDALIAAQVYEKILNTLHLPIILPQEKKHMMKKRCLHIMTNLVNNSNIKITISQLEKVLSILDSLNSHESFLKLQILAFWEVITRGNYIQPYSSHKDIETLINIISSAEEEVPIMQQAIAIIANISYRSEIKEIICQQEGIKILLPLLTSEDRQIQKNAMQAFKSLTSFHPKNLQVFKALDGINILTQLTGSDNQEIKVLADKILLSITGISASKPKSSSTTFFFGAKSNNADAKSTSEQKKSSKDFPQFTFHK